ncbi:MAG TPA: L,D-transpeptidase [Rhabdochlamydiaceae bacterium]
MATGINLAGVSSAGSAPTVGDQENFLECLQLCEKVQVSADKWAILVNANTQTLHLFKDRSCVCSYPVSTAAKGLGQESGSSQTPLGLHTVKDKIGDGATADAIFESRVNTGRTATPTEEKAHILGRILWLQGLQQGYNAGTNVSGTVVDSHQRYIYIHGTNHVHEIGRATSAGCVRMRPADVIDLFDKVPEGTPVYIYEK